MGRGLTKGLPPTPAHSPSAVSAPNGDMLYSKYQRSDAAMFLQGDVRAVLYKQLYQQIRQSVLEGRLQPGQRLPSTRSMARI